MKGYLASHAMFSEDRKHRYVLFRQVGMGERAIVFVGLNPSTADENTDDPTVRKCAKWAARWGFALFYMANLHGYRATNPRELDPLDDLEAVGPGNQEALKWMCQKAEIVVACWGQNKLKPYAQTLADEILKLPRVRCLGTNQDGTPKHPLYLASATELQWPKFLWTNGWVFCERCRLMFRPPGGGPGTPKEQRAFMRQHDCEKADR